METKLNSLVWSLKKKVEKFRDWYRCALVNVPSVVPQVWCAKWSWRGFVRGRHFHQWQFMLHEFQLALVFIGEGAGPSCLRNTAGAYRLHSSMTRFQVLRLPSWSSGLTGSSPLP